jgi:DNA-binding Lrp family transcriptional regulator
METGGLIQGYAAIVDPKRAGQTIQAIVQIKLNATPTRPSSASGARDRSAGSSPATP